MLIGEVTIIDRPRAEVMTAATVDVSVREQPGGEPIPSRITVADEHGSLVSLGTVTDATRAETARRGLQRTGAVRLRLPAGRYVIYAGRGFVRDRPRRGGSGERRDRRRHG